MIKLEILNHCDVVRDYAERSAKFGCEVFDLTGRQLSRIGEKEYEKGVYTETLDLSTSPNTIYLIRYRLNDESFSIKLSRDK